jgi:hypothetical protein
MADEKEEVIVFGDPGVGQHDALAWPAARNPGLYMELVFPDALNRKSALPIRLSSGDLQEAYQDAEGRWARNLHSDAVGYQIQDEYRAVRAEVRMRPSLWPKPIRKEV